MGNPEELFAQVFSLVALVWAAYIEHSTAVGVLYAASYVVGAEPVWVHSAAAVLSIALGPEWVAAILNAGAGLAHYWLNTPTAIYQPGPLEPVEDEPVHFV
jgi:hypothetical protein